MVFLVSGREERITYPDERAEKDDAEADAPPDKLFFHGKERFIFHLF